MPPFIVLCSSSVNWKYSYSNDTADNINRETAITRGNPIMLLPPTTFCVLHAYVLTCLQDSWSRTVMKGFKPATFGSVL